jgi:hypothetical protein
MSSSGSGSKSTSPVPPGGAAPSPLLIGKAFIKQYYQVLSSSPESIHKFYKPTSTLSHGLEASSPAVPVTLGDVDPKAITAESVKNGPFGWAVPPESDPDDVLAFDFGRGAIDAQESVNGGILLVASGRVTLPGAGGGDRPFVHTFFLNNAAPLGKRKQFYVHNDVLRVLSEATEDADEWEETEQALQAVTAPELVDEKQTVAKEGQDQKRNQEQESVDNVGIKQGVEVAKEGEAANQQEVSEEAEEHAAAAAAAAAIAAPKVDRKGRRSGERKSRGSRGRGSRSSSPSNKGSREPAEDLSDAAAAAAKPKVPGSWASLVATGGSGGPAITPHSPARGGQKVQRQQGVEETKDGDNSAAAAEAPAKAEEKGGRPPPPPQASNRVPNGTLIVKSLPNEAKESDIRAIFEPYAIRSGAGIATITILAAKAMCFVDFDKAEPVAAILRDHQAAGPVEGGPFQLHGKVLLVEKKSADYHKERRRESAGGGGGRRNRSASPGNGMHEGGGGKTGPGNRRPSPRVSRPRAGGGGSGSSGSK